MGLSIGNIIYIAVLLVNAIAILSEERFLARIGWSTQQAQPGQQGFAQPYDAYGGGATQGDISMKGKMINLIGAVRTLMRSELCCHKGAHVFNLLICFSVLFTVPLIGINLVIIVYELVLG
ncbi:Yos1-like protein [Hysterangium stoloniferum]|nr:Yos1-like protein [Hysterangium stoloniferum]